jgi:FkbM family methyltransferase
VEPDPVAFEILKRNVELNRSDVELVREGIAGRDGMVEMGSGYLGASTTRMNPIAAEGIGAWEDGHRFEVHCSTLSGFVERHEIKAPLFIKIDVEGAEGEIIRDSMDWIDENKPDMSIELHPGWWENPAAVRADLSRLTGIYGSVSETRGGKMVFLHA